MRILENYGGERKKKACALNFAWKALKRDSGIVSIIEKKNKNKNHILMFLICALFMALKKKFPYTLQNNN